MFKGWVALYKMEEEYLHNLFYNPESPASFGGVEAVYGAVKEDGKFQLFRNRIRTWLKQQDTYTLNPSVTDLREIE